VRSLLFLTEKQDDTVEARHHANGSIQQNWRSSGSTASPTVCAELVLLLAAMDAEEGQDIAVSDVPNAFIQKEVSERDEEGNRMIMKIHGALVDVLVVWI